MYFSKISLITVNLIILFLGLIPLYKRNLYKKTMMFQLLIYTLFYGLRNKRVGLDTINYLREFKTGTGGYFEFGFQKLGFLLYKLKVSESFYLVIIIIIQLSFIYKGLINFKVRNSFKGIILWGMLTNTVVVFNTINALRQGVAASILFYTVSLLDRNLIKKEVIKCFAYSMHKSSILLIFLKKWEYFRKKKLKKIKDYYILFFLVLILGIILRNIFIKMGIFSSRYVNTETKILLLKICQSLLVFTIAFFVRTKMKNKNKINNIIGFYTFILVIIFTFYFINEVANRYLYYLGYYSILIFIYFIDLYKNRNVLLKTLILLNLSYYILLINTVSYQKMFRL